MFRDVERGAVALAQIEAPTPTRRLLLVLHPRPATE